MPYTSGAAFTAQLLSEVLSKVATSVAVGTCPRLQFSATSQFPALPATQVFTSPVIP